MFGRNRSSAPTGSGSGRITHQIELGGACGACGTWVTTTHDHTAMLGQRGTATATVTHCGGEVDVSGQF